MDCLSLSELPSLPALHLAVVGHVEVVSFVGVDTLPGAGEIRHAHSFQELPAGGGAVVAAQMARLSGRPVSFFTALGRDAVGEKAAATLLEMGLDLQVAWRDAPTRRAVTFVDGSGERTITVIGERLTPRASDPLPWERLADCGGVFVTAADAAALSDARAASFLAATPRVRLPILREAGVVLDALIGSGSDSGERYEPGDLDPEPALYLATAGAEGGTVWPGGGFRSLARSRPVVDTYGAGDCFAAGFTTARTAGWTLLQALSLACHCGMACLDGAGPYAGQLDRRQLEGGSWRP